MDLLPFICGRKEHIAKGVVKIEKERKHQGYLLAVLFSRAFLKIDHWYVL